ncbi:MAG: hypothetical protein HY765_03015 [Rhodomicrobium sp.]|nr:hypothetical protein [Rhodomicrobium sp.]
MPDAGSWFKRPSAIETKLPYGAPDAFDDGFGRVMRVDSRSAGRVPFLGCQQFLQFYPLGRPGFGSLAVPIFIENCLGKGAPAGVADELAFFVRGRFS